MYNIHGSLLQVLKLFLIIYELGRYHNATIPIGSFYIDTYPVTNSDYLEFSKATNYSPSAPDDYNYLMDRQNGTYPQGWDNKPVTWVSLGYYCYNLLRKYR